MFDAADAPPLLVQHQVVDHAANRELCVLFDRIVFQVLVSTVAIGDVPPLGIAVADAATQSEAHGRALDVEGLIVLQHP